MASGRDEKEDISAAREPAAALDQLTAPLAPAEFFDRHYDLAPLHCPRADPRRYRHLLTLEALDAFLDGADLRHNMVELVRGQRRVPPDSFTSADGRVVASAVAEHYLQGATIILPHLQESMPALGGFCRALEMLFSCHVQANAYLTPGGHSGFGAHQDGHDIFVLQVEGVKSWRLYDRSPPSAFRGDAGDVVPSQAREVRGSFTLQPGDCLYLPRGVVHEADNEGDAPSLHITIGLLTRTWGDLVLAAVAQVARSDPAFARPLPPGYARPDFDNAAMSQGLRSLINGLGEKVRTVCAVDLLAAEFLHGRRPKIAGIIAAGANVPREGERFCRRPLVQFRIAHGADGPVLTGPGGDLQFAGEERAALDVALSGKLFAPLELECPDPKRLFRRLWANGYLEGAPDR